MKKTDTPCSRSFFCSLISRLDRNLQLPANGRGHEKVLYFNAAMMYNECKAEF